MLRAWARMMDTKDANLVPDLVCVGRLGWNIEPFIDEFLATEGLGGKVRLLTDSLPDKALLDLYTHCEFTLYMSQYEGWGLPISESLRLGKPVVAARTSSLREAGGDLAVYVNWDDVEGLAETVWKLATDKEALARQGRLIAERYEETSWMDIAHGLMQEASEAAALGCDSAFPMPKVGVEYGFGTITPFASASRSGYEYLEHLRQTRRLPLTGQVNTPERRAIAELMLFGGILAACEAGVFVDWRNSPIEIRFRRPSATDLTLALATHGTPVHLKVTCHSPQSTWSETVPVGSTLLIDLGAGEVGALVEVALSIEPLADHHYSGDHLLGLRSLLLLDTSDFEEKLDLAAEHSSSLLGHSDARRQLVEKAPPGSTHHALERELASVYASTSWRITSPLRWLGKSVRRRESRRLR